MTSGCLEHRFLTSPLDASFCYLHHCNCVSSSLFISYAQTIPSRFRKEICQAATSRDGQIASDSLFRVLYNIGAADRVTKEELETVCEELGDTSPNHTPAMPVDKMMEILQNKI
jgi:hypothetical protein